MKTQKKTKIMAALLAIIATLSMSVPAYAGTGAFSRTYSGSFSKAWRKYASSSDLKKEMNYGYDTFAFNEDYVDGRSTVGKSRAYLKNDNGYHYGSWAAIRQPSKVSARHKGSRISYFLEWPV